VWEDYVCFDAKEKMLDELWTTVKANTMQTQTRAAAGMRAGAGAGAVAVAVK